MKLEPLKGSPRLLSDVEREYILRTLHTLGWNRSHTAFALGIAIRTLRNKLTEYRRAGWPTSAEEYAKYMGKV